MKPGIYYIPKHDELYVYNGGATAYMEYSGCTVSVVIDPWRINNAVYIGEY